jgi:hypothetical protein
MATFADLGIEIPLFAGPVDDADGWSGDGACVICGEERPGFALGIGDDVIVTCDSCGSSIAVPADGEAERCRSCGRSNALDGAVEGGHACWRCLRAGRWASTMDTEAGMIRWEDAVRGRTHGVPFASEPTVWVVGSGGAQEASSVAGAPLLAGFPTTEPNEDGWRSAIIPSEILLELTRTPSYATWQGERWLFHCQRPMRYIGRWGRSQFNAAAPDGDGEALAAGAAELPLDVWRGLADEPSSSSSVTVYVFRCPECDAVRGHWDVD